MTSITTVPLAWQSSPPCPIKCRSGITRIGCTHPTSRSITTNRGRKSPRIWCRGEGGMRHIDEKTHEPDLAAEWKKEMHKYADPKTGLDVVDLEEAMIEQPKEHSGILADHISLYLIRQIAAQHSARPNTPASAGKRTQAGPQLHHLIAVQRNELVAMVSKQIETESKRLEIWFQDAPSAASNSDDGRPRLRRSFTHVALARRLGIGDERRAAFRIHFVVERRRRNRIARRPTGACNPRRCRHRACGKAADESSATGHRDRRVAADDGRVDGALRHEGR